MYAPWVRVCRSLALHAPQARIATRQRRLFHASSSRWTAPSSPPDDDGSGDQPEKKGDKKDENIFGGNCTNGSGDSQGGRQKRSSGSLRLRALRNRTAEELPPVHLPHDFHKEHIFRYDEEPGKPDFAKPSLLWLQDHVWPIEGNEPKPIASGHSRFRDPDLELQSFPNDTGDVDLFGVMFDAVAWNEVHLSRAITDLQTGELGNICRRGDFIISIALMTLVSSASRKVAGDCIDKKEILASGGENILSDKDMNRKFVQLWCMLNPGGDISPDLDERTAPRFLQAALRSSLSMDAVFGRLHFECLLEAVTQIKADFAVEAPKSIKLSDLKRPITVIHMPYSSDFAYPKHFVQQIATDVKADVLHMTAYDIANVAGSYLGQDAARAPSYLSLLGYRAAENSGRIPAINVADESEDTKSPFSILISHDRPRGERKRAYSSAEKSGDVWEDMKINAALEELVHSADLETSELRPLIVHVHDFNAINMDSECGASVITKIRRIVDGFWSEGRKIVLIGTCSSRDAPKGYLKAIKELEAVERVITLHIPHKFLDTARCELIHRTEFIHENNTNLKIMLENMLKPGFDGAPPPINFSLDKINRADLPASISTTVLPMIEIHRIAKTMVGLSTWHGGSIDQSILEEAVDLLKRIDETTGPFINAGEEAATSEGKRKARDISLGLGRLDPRNENHEDKLLGGLVKSKDIRTTFNDVHAPRGTIESIKMLTQLSLVRPEAFSYGVLATDRIPGCLLYGPPGTGKTLLAKAVAKESGANMIEVSGATINNMWYGESEKNVRALFRLAKKKEPLVIFIDEADAMLGARGNDISGARRETINQFLREWDGMDSTKAFIMVATNRPFDLDEAVLRRLPRKLLIDLPLQEDRAAILKIHLKDEVLDGDVSIDDIAKRTALYSGSDLKNVCVAAAMTAVKEEMEAEANRTGSEPFVWAEKRTLTRKHFDKALTEISASVNEDMKTLGAIKKFDEKYGDGTRRKKSVIGFGVGSEPLDSDAARVRSGKS